ncbi:[Ribosomal protein S18]-alanine N-acetyltransferase [Lentibacillus sp. JNUCC-1]|uniref:ribosomal protein S18-alanine N-acetyltransferase n=1 Tax=Lentibacillus sp. JNUCC-1 TaxID=2654513 RepID=UPI001322BB06|nr:ribosomal protein S18-alanine N-acetyltransferase [Lentibacillus sp. JNUCC-1]MUV38517.1 [Ribosomal protein S18]-alanine N-acetyltransferase [Lentibacillus sp. JNUCC-1]
MDNDHFNIRQMIRSDLSSIMAIDQKVYTSPWTEKVYEQEINHNPHAYYAVVEIDNVVAGYAGAWIVMEDAQITNIVVDPDYRGRKLGKSLFKHMLQVAMLHGAERLSLEVRASNQVAQNMYRQFGLVPGGIRKNYYQDNHEDAVVMWVNLR